MEPGELTPLLAGLIAGAVVYLLVTRAWRRRSGLKAPPMVWGIPYLYDEFWPFMKDFSGTVERRFREKGGPCIQVYRMGEKIYFVRGLNNIKRLLNAEHVLVEDQPAGTLRRLLGPLSVACTQFEAHKALRKVLEPAFNYNATAAFVPGTVRIIEGSMQEWAQKGHIQAQACMKRTAFTILVRVMLEWPESFIEPDTMDRFIGLFRDWALAFTVFPYRIPGLALDKGLKAREEILEMIEANLPKFDASAGQDKQGTESIKHAFSHMSLPQQKDVALNLLIAGWETTASSMCRLLHALNAHPQVLQALRDEQQQVMEKHGREITEAAISDMHYLTAVMKECQRCHPLVGQVPRRALVDLDIDGFYIPKGAHMWLFLRDGMRNDERWADERGTPLDNARFNPDRWLGEEGKRTGGYLPFSAGQRICLGWQPAQMELKIWLAVLARGYQFRVCNPHAPMVMAVIPQFSDGLETDFSSWP